MLKKVFFLLIIFFLIPLFSVFSDTDDGNEATEKVVEKPASDFWIGFGGEVSMYSYEGFSYGGSFSLGYGAGSSIGLKISYFFNEEGIDTLEACLLLRFYILGSNAYSGPFIQVLGGVALFNRTGEFSIPSNVGIFSIGAGFGWRFLFANRFYLEPFIRGGYPYMFNGTVAVGVRF